MRWAAYKDVEFLRLAGLIFERVEELIRDADESRPVLLSPQKIAQVKPIPKRSYRVGPMLCV